MKIDIEYLKDTFKIGYEAFEASRKEASEVWEMYHNRQYTSQQENILANRGQPIETFNVVKLFARMLLGYYATVVNDVKVSPAQRDDIMSAAVLNDLVGYTFRKNILETEMDKVKLDGILTGLMVGYKNVVRTGETDQFGRPLYEIEIDHVPAKELVLDPMSRKEDYSDYRWVHRFKWISEEELDYTFGEEKRKNLEAYHNHLDIDEAEFTSTYNVEFQGNYKKHDNYLVVHTIVKDQKGKTWSIFWSGFEILDKKEVTYKEVANPYNIQKVHYSHKAEYYGLFREITETQKAINQALVKIQLMVNTQKAFVEEGAVDNLANFTDQFNRVNAVIPVKDLRGIQIENLTREVLDQYTVIDKALDRIQRVLSINDSFLGMAYASDSGRKVQLQQNASVTALRYLTAKIENFYRGLGWDILNLIKQYFTAYQVVAIADNYEGQRWAEVNKPLQVPTKRVNPQTGQPETRMVFEEVLDPASGEPLEDETGNLIIAPIPERESEIAFTKADIKVDSIAYNDEDEQNQALIENILNGQAGQFLMQINPAGYAQAASLSIKNMKSKYSPELANIFQQAVGGNQQ